MEIKSISEFYSYSLFIFDLDNTVFNEEEYLFQGYEAIAEHFSGVVGLSKKELSDLLKNLFRSEGREQLFNKFLDEINLDDTYIPACLDILRSFRVEKELEITPSISKILSELIRRNKSVFILTNGNVSQQKNKIKNIRWKGLDSKIRFVFADDLKPKPSPAGIEHILKLTNISAPEAIFTGDSHTDMLSAINAGITYMDVSDLQKLE